MRPIYTLKKYLLFFVLPATGLLAGTIPSHGQCNQIAVDVEIAGVDYPASLQCGHFNLLVDVTITNASDAPIQDIDAQMDLAGEFGAAFVGVTAPPVCDPGPIDQSSMNDQFDGDLAGGDAALIKDPAAALEQNQSVKIRVLLEIAPDNAPAAASAMLAKALVSARTQDGSAVCEAEPAEGSAALGDCWEKSRLMAANDQVNVTLGACTAVITADMILENHYPDCDLTAYPAGGFYRLKLIGLNDQVLQEGPFLNIDDPSLFINGQAAVKVENVSDFCNPVWGYVQLEDKAGAVVAECPSEVHTATVEREVQILSGTIPVDDDLTEEVVNFASYSCFIEDGRLASCERTYDLIPFEVDKTDIYTFELLMDERPGLMAIFQGDFDPENPCENIIGQSDINIFDQAILPNGPDQLEARIRLVAPLREDQTYYLLTTHAGCHVVAEDYRYTVYSDGDGKLKDVDVTKEEATYRLLCDDVPYILNKPESVAYLPSPIFTDNCTSQTDLDVRFEDELFEEGDCGALYILRTWTARDEAGNEEAVCEQKIYFSRPSLYDIYKPNTTVPIECDETYPTLLDGNPHPDHTGYPYVVSAFGIHDLRESYCNVGADFEDIARIEVCDNGYKIVRQWTLADWCDVGSQWELNNSPLINFRQIIKIGDFSAPVVDCPSEDLNFTTGPFDCTASVPLLNPRVTDNCSSGWEVTVQILTTISNPVYDNYGELTGYEDEEILLAEGPAGTYASDIPTGTHTMRFIVVDNCGNRAVKECPISVRDAVAPVTVCDDDLNVSISGEGIAKVTAEDVDEGSWDNCTPVGLKVSRSFADNACRDAYLEQVIGIGFSDLEKITVTGPGGETAIYVDKATATDTILRQRDTEFLTWWEDAVFFTCCDVNQQVTLELLAVDGDGLVSSYWAGDSNGSFCWFDLTVEDKIRPECIPPAPVEIYCTDLPPGFDPNDIDQLTELFGPALGDDNCPGYTVTERTPVSDLYCDIGTITRTFEVTDAQGKKSPGVCEQTIEILERHEYEIKFPKDASFYCGEEPMPDTATFTELGCDLLSVSVDDQFFDAVGDECYKIFRTYRVINWCEYDGEADPVVVGRDEDCDGKAGDEDVWVLVRPGGEVFFDRDNDENNDIPAADTKELRCEELSNPRGHWINTDIDQRAAPSRDISSTGFWEYTQVIKVFDRTVPEITIQRNEPFCVVSPDQCTGEVFIPFTVEDACSHYSNFSVQVFYDEFHDGQGLQNITSLGLVDRYPKYTIAGDYPIGKHSFELVVRDGCGNSTSLTIPFEVVDCKVASPSCIHGLSVELARTEPGTDADGDGDEDAGAMTIWATDFIASPIVDCSEPVTFSINRVGETPSPEQQSLIVTCDDEGILPVEIYAWDQGFNPYLLQPDGTMGGPNFDFCETVLYVQDNMFDLCAGGATVSVSGLVVTEEAEPVENVEMRLSGVRAESMRTGADGLFAFDGLPLGGDYTIAPIFDEDYLNGVSTFDIVLMSKHILGIQKLSSPYQMIAADVNNSGSISALDIIQLRKLVLSIDRKFRNNGSWRFIRSNYTFPDPENPWRETFPEIANYNNLSAAISSADFTAVKIGDVSGNARANSRASSDRSPAGEAYLEFPDREVKAGQIFTAAFRLPERSSLEGLQLALQWDVAAAELVDIEHGLAKAAHLGVHLTEEGILPASWNQQQGPGAEDRLFILTLRARQDLRTRDLFQLNASQLTPEAYNTSEEVLTLKLRTSSSLESESTYELYQNRPNPFSGQTQISFYLPAATQAEVSIYDINGKLLHVVRGQYDRGVHQLSISKERLDATGVLYYTLRADDFVATRKMILIE